MVGQDTRSGVVRLVSGDGDELLLASGAICATLLLCDLMGGHDGARGETPAGFLNVGDIDGLPFGGAVATRLFRSGGSRLFACFHRAVAEYLGARWLARCLDDGLVDGGVLSLFEAGGSVPTPLRGLHAWIARLSSILAGPCIAADHYAVLCHGET